MKPYHQLSQEERYLISAGRHRYASLSALARAIGRSVSTVTRELKRNCRHQSQYYTASVAHLYSVARRRRERRGTHFSAADWDLVVGYLKKKWSPQQISCRLAADSLLSISHQTIYRYLLKGKKQKGRLYLHLRHIPKRRRKRYGTKDSRGILPGKRHISTRPAAVETRKEFGHWEGDTVMGSDRHHCLLTLVEKMTGRAIIKKLHSRTALEVNTAIVEVFKQHIRDFKTITFDNGTEFHDYQTLESAFPVTCYFATPYHSWERGSNENLNGLIRQYLPKGEDMAWIDQLFCDRTAEELNDRPRKRHGFRTPKEVYLAQI